VRVYGCGWEAGDRWTRERCARWLAGELAYTDERIGWYWVAVAIA
jgi:hypothetical protein